MAFYTFARAADDVADDGERSTEDKLSILAAMLQQVLSGTDQPFDEVARLVASLQETGITPRHAQDLLKAFMWDAGHPRTADWAALMAYCDLSAAPVGRFLIDLLGGMDGGYRPSDALCAALQVLNHLQDIQDDLRTLERVYVPADWMSTEGVGLEDLAANACTRDLRTVLNRMLDGVDALLDEADILPKRLHSRALAREAAGITAIARHLSYVLRRRDPLAERVELGKGQMLVHFAWGAMRA